MSESKSFNNRSLRGNIVQFNTYTEFHRKTIGKELWVAIDVFVGITNFICDNNRVFRWLYRSIYSIFTAIVRLDSGNISNCCRVGSEMVFCCSNVDDSTWRVYDIIKDIFSSVIVFHCNEYLTDDVSFFVAHCSRIIHHGMPWCTSKNWQFNVLGFIKTPCVAV